MRADEQEPNMRPTVAGERTKDCEAHTIKPTGGKAGRLRVKGSRAYFGRSARRREFVPGA